MGQSVVTRFAPSPTGFLHIGGARTALFNWLFARHHGGQFLLRVEDTDAKRSTTEAIDAIIDGLEWLGLDWDGETCFQSRNAARHRSVAEDLLASGNAYRCYATPDELTALRESQRAAGLPLGYDGRWRDKGPEDAPDGAPFVVRLKAPSTGETVLEDLVQGCVTVRNDTLDDMVLLRSDGSPTYMLSVVVDDHDMGITHAIRGDDHLTNAFRQLQIFAAMGWTPPIYGHIPLIHGPDGAKMSKRHGALGIEAYRDMGLLAEAVRNYLLRLGWSHGDDEIISTDEAIKWFSADGLGRSPSRFDMQKLENINAHYLREAPHDELAAHASPYLEAELGRGLSSVEMTRFQAAIGSLAERSKTLIELAKGAVFYFAARPLALDAKASKAINEASLPYLKAVFDALSGADEWNAEALDALIKRVVEASGAGFGKTAQPLRASVCGTMASPALVDVLVVLGREEVLARIADQLPQDVC